MTLPPSDIFEEFAVYTNKQMSEHFYGEIPNQLMKHQKENLGLEALHAKINKAYEQTPEDYINLGFIMNISDLYDENEQYIIKHLSSFFPRIALGFSYFSLLDGSLRPSIAANFADIQRELPWETYILPATSPKQSNKDRKIDRDELTNLVFFGDPKKDSIKLVFTHHDYCSALTGFFTPAQQLDDDDKKVLENAAIVLITEKRENDLHAKDIYDAYEIYEGNRPEHDEIRIKCKDLEILEAAMKALYTTWICPKDKKDPITKKLQPFLDKAETGLKTQQAKDFYTHFKKTGYKPGDTLEILTNETQRLLFETQAKDTPNTPAP